MSDKDIDALSGVETTGHEWDGIKELNNPMPRWWLWTFYLTIVFAFGYVLYYPAIPLIEGSTMGISGTTNRSVLKDEMAALAAGNAQINATIVATDLEDIRADDALFRYSVAGGSSLYKVYCTQCHGSGAQGAVGYPNLNDDDWIWGGDLEAIYTTIAHGVRNEDDDDARISDMPRFGADDILESEDIYAAAEFVLKLSRQEHDVVLADKGAVIFEENCAACHGDAGEGVRELGGPKLADALWLYGGTREDIIKQVRLPRQGVMPSWQARLGEANVKKLAVYIHSLGGGESAVEE